MAIEYLRHFDVRAKVAEKVAAGLAAIPSELGLGAAPPVLTRLVCRPPKDAAGKQSLPAIVVALSFGDGEGIPPGGVAGEDDREYPVAVAIYLAGNNDNAEPATAKKIVAWRKAIDRAMVPRLGLTTAEGETRIVFGPIVDVDRFVSENVIQSTLTVVTAVREPRA